MRKVSILTGPGGPVLPGLCAWRRATEVFQSSPGPEARCYDHGVAADVRVAAVSILTGPGGPVLRR